MSVSFLKLVALTRRYRTSAVVYAILGGLIAGWGLAQLGKNFRASPELKIDGIGRIQTVALPNTAMSIEDMNSFTIKIDGADDYTRVFVNNYLALNQETSESVFYIPPPDSEVFKQLKQSAVDRRAHRLGEVEVKPYLRRGKNFVIIELENSIMSTCIVNVEMKVSGIRLPSFPRILPEGFDVEMEAVNDRLLKEYRRLRESTLEDATCSRRIFEITIY